MGTPCECGGRRYAFQHACVVCEQVPPHGQRERGQRAYEADVEKRPNYPDGAPRKAWAQLGNAEKWS